MRIAVVEDDSGCTAQLQGYLERYRQERGVQYEVDSFQDGMDIVADYRPVYSVIFLDIEMPQLNGMDAARQIRKQDASVMIIFITNMAKYAIRGYEVGALDFVLKPVSYFAFSMKLDKAISALKGREQKSLLLSTEDGLRKIPALEICYMEVLNHRLVVHTTQGAFRTSGSLKEMEETLKGQGFVRCNKGYLVNLRHITLIKGDTVTAGGDTLLISRRKREEFLAAVTDYYGGGRI